MTSTYTINSELGLWRAEAASIEAAKAAYTDLRGYDFNSNAPGTWYWIDENGVRVEDRTENMPA